MLGSFAASQGFRVVEFGEVASTNDICFAQARAGDDRLWIVAEAQTGGRGRRGRAWSSPRGNLYASLLVIDPAPTAVAAQIGFVAALALHDAASGLLSPAAAASLKLKWPNDLLIGGAKTSGILVEATTLPTRRTAVVVGIGVNVAAQATDAPYPTTHLLAHARDGVGDVRNALFAALSDAMARRLAQWSRGAGFSAIRTDWLARAAGLGRALRVEGPGAPIVGVLRTMDDGGRLIVDCDDGRVRTVEAGDVFLTG